MKKVLILVGAVAVFAAAFFLYPLIPTGNQLHGEPSVSTGNLPSEPAVETLAPVSTKPEPEAEPSVVRFKSAGDNLIHSSIYNQANKRADGNGYDFSYAYENLGTLISDADLSTLNQETIIAPDLEPSDYPCFNSPPELTGTMLKLGFDVFNQATNHTMDRGAKGLTSALNYWKEFPNATVVGAYLNQEDFSKIRTLEVNGITFSFLGVTGPTNGLSVPQGSELIWMLASDEEALEKRVKEAAAISDFVVMNIHWGEEYTHEPTDRQLSLGQMLADWGVDMIIGHHPHVIQPVDILTAADGRKVPVVYSLGNFISAQDRPARMLGGVLDWTVTREKPGDKPTVTDIQFIPIVTHYDASFSNIRVYPYADYTAELAKNHGVRGKYPEFGIEYLDKVLNDVIGAEYLAK